ncbi:MAG: hypothetical protein M3340_03175 [Actinomycetota bacterium]|nr:hypothetical protein [Actinomycetota bacterium]
MSVPAEAQVLVLGVAGAGKTTLLIQLFGRLQAGEGMLRLRESPRNLARLQTGLTRLNQGLPVQHTPTGDEFVQLLPAEDAAGVPIDLALPDYSGEDLKKVVTERRLPERWRELATSSEHWMLLMRLSQHPQRPDVLSKPLGTLAAEAQRTAKGEDPDQLPLDMWGVELLQMLQYARSEIGMPRPRLSLVMSCWDELDRADATPEKLARERLALLHSYCRAHWPDNAYRVLGLSAQGQPLDENRPAGEYLNNGPERMGWLVLSDGDRDPDLTRLGALG